MTGKLESGEEERILCTQRARGSRARVETRTVFLCQALEHGEGFLQKKKKKKADSHPSSAGYTCTRLHTDHLWPRRLVPSMVLLQLSLSTPSRHGCWHCHRPPLCSSAPAHSLRDPHSLRQKIREYFLWLNLRVGQRAKTCVAAAGLLPPASSLPPACVRTRDRQTDSPRPRVTCRTPG